MAEEDQQTLESSLRKLLSSHLSIYNALTNPDLDLSPASPLFAGKERYTPPPLDFPVAMDPVSLHNWSHINVRRDGLSDLTRQALASSASPRPASASILSITSDEENPSDSIVVVPSFKSAAGSKVMVFETDEEDEGDDYTYIRSGKSVSGQFGDDDKTLTSHSDKHQKHISVPTNLHSLFIMPKMSLLDNGKHAQLTILSSSNAALRSETLGLIDFIRNNVDVSLKVHVHHLVIALTPLKFDISVMKSSDMLFLVNDGSLLFIECMDALLRSCENTAVPKLTVINVMTTNYFINLFEIINGTRPQQIWKTPSLTNSKLLCKLQTYITEELDEDSGRHAQEFKAKSKKFNARRKSPCKGNKPEVNSVYNTISTTRKPDYKVIERQIRTEMLTSLSYANIDPLQLLSNLTHLSALLGAFKRYFGSGGSPGEDSDWLSMISKHLWLICSFSLGIGVGVTVASGAVTSTGKGFSQISQYFVSGRTEVAGNCQQLVAANGYATEFAKSEFAMRLLATMEKMGGSVSNALDGLSESLAGVTDNSVVHSAIEYLKLAISELKTLSHLAMESVWGGFKKSSNMLLASVW